MTAFSIVMPTNPDLPGHWQYLSGTLGDAVLLPTLVGALVHSAALLRPGRRDKLVAGLGAIGGALAGALVQYAWWADPSPQTNWTLPAPHTFSAPGWYHAAFFVAVSAATAGGAVLLVARIIRDPARVDERDWGRSFALFLAAGSAFLTLVVADSWGSADTSASTATLIGCALSLGTVVSGFSAAARRHRGRVLRLSIAAIAIGVAAGAAAVALRAAA